MSIPSVTRSHQGFEPAPKRVKHSKEEMRCEAQAKERIYRMTLPKFTDIQAGYISPFLEGREIEVNNLITDLHPLNHDGEADPFIPTEVRDLVYESSLAPEKVKLLDEFCRARNEVIVLAMMHFLIDSPRMLASELPNIRELSEQVRGIPSPRNDGQMSLSQRAHEAAPHIHDSEIFQMLLLAGKTVLSLDAHRKKPLDGIKEVFVRLNSIEDYKKEAEVLKEWFKKNKTKTERLEELDVSSYGLTEIPAFVCELGNLKSLRLDGNQLLKLPAEFSRLRGLKSLSLQQNLIKTFPEEITRLTELEKLDLKNNQLIEIPPSILNLTNLNVLDLKDNPLKSLPNECRVLCNEHKLTYGLSVWDDSFVCFPFSLKNKAIDPILHADEVKYPPMVHIPGKPPVQFQLGNRELFQKCVDHELFYDIVKFKRDNSAFFVE